MRVLQVAARASTLAGFALPLMTRLRQDGLEVEALAGFDGAEDQLQSAGFPVHRWPMDHTFDPLALWRARRYLRRLLVQQPYDIVHVHGSFAGIAGNSVACALTGTLIYTQHGFYVHDGLSPLLRWAWLEVEKIGLRPAHRVICVSEAERDLALSLGAGDACKFVHVPGAGVNTERFRLSQEQRQARRSATRQALGLREDDRILLTVSRLTWHKGYREMIDAAVRLRDDGLGFRFLAAGSGKDEAAIRRAVRQANLEPHFLLLGWRDDILALHCAADIFVFASHREGLPIAPIEAMASGLPVVTSDLPGCREEIAHERSGLLYGVGNAGELAAALRRLLDDAELRRRLGSQARERAAAFDVARVLDAQLAVYRQAAAAP